MLQRKRLLLLEACLLTVAVVACSRPAPPQVLTPTALGRGAPVAVSQDGQSLLVIRAEPELNEGWLQPTDGSQSRKILEFTSTSFYASFSPDGQYLAWSSDGLWLAKSDGTDAQRLLDDQTVGPVAWSPASEQLAVVVGESIKRVDLQGRVQGEVVQAASVRALSWASLSAGERIFFVSFPSDQPPYVANVLPDGQGLAQIAVAEAFDLAGDRLFVAEPLSAGPLRLMDAVDGANAAVVVASGVQSVSVRPPDHAQVAYILQGGDEIASDLWLAGADGQSQQQLTAGAPVLGQLWSPDGKRLYFAVFDTAAGEEDDPFQVQALDIP